VNWLLLIILCVVLVEIVMRLPFLAPLKALQRSSSRAIRVVSAKAVSDHWKEKAMGAYAQKTFVASAQIAGPLALVLGIATLVVLGMDLLSEGFQTFILTWAGLGGSVVAASLYVFVRRSSSMSRYSFLDRVLHRAALQFRPLAELAFDLDQNSTSFDVEETKGGKHVFVSGLARSGTTILMRHIYAAGDFCSLTYRHMPFVLAPNLWGKMGAASKKKEAPKERAHGDRILVDVDSPESLDEVFWRIFDGEEYIADTYLSPHKPDAENSDKFASYVSAILKADSKGRTRYLSKNNNNILRLNAIRRIFPNAVILIPFRDPITHAFSLMRQHRNFVAQQQDDTFVLAYMNWLGHHEFGLGHRPFRMDKARGERLAKRSPDNLDYWLEIWAQVYAWLEKTAPEDAVFVCYEDLCQDATVWGRLAALCETAKGDDDHEPFSIAKPEIDVMAEQELVNEATAIYDRLVDRARAALDAAKDRKLDSHPKIKDKGMGIGIGNLILTKG